jgi:hypothetical protein
MAATVTYDDMKLQTGRLRGVLANVVSDAASDVATLAVPFNSLLAAFHTTKAGSGIAAYAHTATGFFDNRTIAYTTTDACELSVLLLGS